MWLARECETVGLEILRGVWLEDSLLVLLGISGSLIAGLLAMVVALIRRNGNAESEENPNFYTLDTKLNDILIVLTRIEANIGGRQHG